MLKMMINKNKMSKIEEIYDINLYLRTVTHSWLMTLNILAFSLVPLFIVLDIFTMPSEFLFRFGTYRAACTLLMIIQYFFIRNTKPHRLSFIHAYVLNLVVTLMIVMMTIDLGGFNSSYYAGLNLVIIAVNSFLPWKAIHSALNALFTILIYFVLNLVTNQSFDPKILINNLYFLIAMGVVSVGINSVKYKLIKKEFTLRAALKEARDSLWGEMKLAKKIQTALLPIGKSINHFQIAATMLPAEEVGGDYYDIITTKTGESWIAIGDVSGHGVDSGLVMLMAQTSIFTVLNSSKGLKPSMVINNANNTIRENIARMGANKYMSISILHLSDGHFIFSGKHQDILIYRAAEKRVEEIQSCGTWIGIADDIGKFLKDIRVPINKNDIMLLFTDGVTEATNKDDEMFGEDRLEEVLSRYADKELPEMLDLIVGEVLEFQEKQDDDITLVMLKKV